MMARLIDAAGINPKPSDERYVSSDICCEPFNLQESRFVRALHVFHISEGCFGACSRKMGCDHIGRGRGREIRDGERVHVEETHFDGHDGHKDAVAGGTRWGSLRNIPLDIAVRVVEGGSNPPALPVRPPSGSLEHLHSGAAVPCALRLSIKRACYQTTRKAKMLEPETPSMAILAMIYVICRLLSSARRIQAGISAPSHGQPRV